MATDQSVRSYMNQAGYDNSKIGYNPDSGWVTYNGQNFGKPKMNVNGTTFDSPDTIKAWDSQFRQNNPMMFASSSPQAATQTTTQTPITSAANPYVDSYTQLIKSIQDRMNAPLQDVYRTPEYAAAKAQADRQAQQSILQGQEMLGNSGMARSSDAIRFGQNAQNQANEYLQTQLVPQIMNQLNSRKQQDIANQVQQSNLLYNLLNRDDQQRQQGFQNNLATAGLTGNFTPDQQTFDTVKRIMDANSAAYADASPEERQRLHAENVRLAASIGGTDTTGNGDYAFGPMRTLQGKSADLNNMQVMAQLTGKLPDGTPTNAAQQQQLSNLWTVAQQTGMIPDQLADLYSLPRGTRTQDAIFKVQQIAIEQQNANTSSANAATSARNAENSLGNQDLAKKFEIWDRTGFAPSGIPGVAEGTPLAGKKSTPSISEKDSTDNYSVILEDLGQKGVDKATAMKLAQANRNNLSDADYKKLINYINESF